MFRVCNVLTFRFPHGYEAVMFTLSCCLINQRNETERTSQKRTQARKILFFLFFFSSSSFSFKKFNLPCVPPPPIDTITYDHHQKGRSDKGGLRSFFLTPFSKSAVIWVLASSYQPFVLRWSPAVNPYRWVWLLRFQRLSVLLPHRNLLHIEGWSYCFIHVWCIIHRWWMTACPSSSTSLVHHLLPLL